MKRPNIIFFLSDDLGWRDLGCYGSAFYETPNLDALASRGMRFTNAYAACPVCSPTRASIMTGQYPATVGITDWIDAAGQLHPARGRLVDVPYLKALPPSTRTLAGAFHDGGYRTWHVGKWHLGGPASYPERMGFDVNIGGCENGSPGSGGYFSPWSIEALRDVDVPRGTYLTDFLTDRAVELIRSGRGANTPFFLNFWHYLVHTPIQAPEELVEKYRAKAHAMGIDSVEAFEDGGYFPCEHKKSQRIRRRLIQSDPVYAAMIEKLDWSIGRVLDAVREIGEEENTIVVYTSDNGGLATAEGSPTSNAPLSEGKGWMYEGGTREPLIVAWPGVIARGSSCEEPVTSPDFFPTLLNAAGLDGEPDHHTDGVSFARVLRGDPGFSRGPIFWHYPHYGNQGGTPGSSVRDGDWKLIEFFEDRHVELYNLSEDIGETRDLAGARTEVRDRLSRALDRWRVSVEAKIPSANSEYRPWTDREPAGHSSVKGV